MWHKISQHTTFKLSEGVLKMITKIFEAIEEVLNSIDLGGEQSRQVAGERTILRESHPEYQCRK